MKPGLKNLHLDAAYPVRSARRLLLPHVVVRNRRLDAVMGRAFGQGREVKVHGLLSSVFAVARGATAAGLILLLLLVQARAFWAFEAHVVNVTAEIHQINKPAADPPGGTYLGPQNVELDVLDLTDGPLTIHFTLTGTDPDCLSDTYVSPILIEATATTTLAALACDSAGHKSVILEETYIIKSVEGESLTITTAPQEQENNSPLLLEAPTTTPTTTLPLLDFPAFPPIPTSTPTTTPELLELPPIPDFFDDFPVPTTTPTSTLLEFESMPSTPTSTLPEPPPPPEPPDIEIDRPQPPDLPEPPQPPDLPEFPDLTDKLKPPEPPELPEPPEPPSFPEL